MSISVCSYTDNERLKNMKFRIKTEYADSLRVRIRFLRYEAHVDLLEVVSFMATVNLAALCMEHTASGLPTHFFDFMFRFAPSWVWSFILIGLASCELWASLFNHLWARCWVQFATALVFSAYVVLLLAKGLWLLSPRDYMIFAIVAGFSFIRIKGELACERRSRRRRLKDYAALGKKAV